MDLKSKLGHMANSSVSVNGTVYEVGSDLVARNVSEADAIKLLKNPEAWQPHAERSPVGAAPPPKEPEKESDLDPEKEKEGTGLLEDKGDEAKPEPWPEPSEDMKIEYLREMAEAHDVDFDEGTKPKTLVKRLKKAMYE